MASRLWRTFRASSVSRCTAGRRRSRPFSWALFCTSFATTLPAGTRVTGVADLRFSRRTASDRERRRSTHGYGPANGVVMRRKLMRRLRTVAAAAALLLAATAAVMWVRSYWTADVVGVNRQAPTLSSQTFWSAAGYLGLYRWHMPAASG